jgi:Tfp pilus assembly protein PilN
MVTINLLPVSYRKPKESQAHQLARSPLAFLAAGGLIAIALLLVATTRVRHMRLAGIENQLQQIRSRKASLDALMASVQELRDQKLGLERVIKSRSQWAKRLNQLSNVTPEGVWFTDLLLDAEKGLVIQGSALGHGGEEMVQIGRLAQDLKSDPGFSAMVRDIQIQSIESMQEKETEIVKFTLTGSLVAPSPTQP